MDRKRKASFVCTGTLHKGKDDRMGEYSRAQKKVNSDPRCDGERQLELQRDMTANFRKQKRQRKTGNLMGYEHKRAKRWTALLFSYSKPKPSELQLRKGALLRRTPRPCLAQAPLPLPLPISLASRISAAAPFFKNPLAGPLV